MAIVRLATTKPLRASPALGQMMLNAVIYSSQNQDCSIPSPLPYLGRNQWILVAAYLNHRLYRLYIVISTSIA